MRHCECIPQQDGEADGDEETSQISYQKTTSHTIFVILLHRTTRYCKKTVVIHGVTIPEGTMIHVAIDSIHHDPDNYSDPESYIPER